VLRVRGYFATVYAVGCLAIRFAILPFTEDELLAAILSCHRDHVAFVDNEVAGGPAWTAGAVRAQEVVAAASAPNSIAGAVVPAPTPLDRLRRYIDRNNRRGFIDLRSPRFGKLFFKLGVRRSRGAPVLGYVARAEYWFPYERFEQVAGGAREAAALKKELFRRRLIVTDRRGAAGVSYGVKRSLPDGSRPFFVVLRRQPQRPPARGQALAAAAPVELGPGAPSCLAG
jgi:hypothetical protein